MANGSWFGVDSKARKTKDIDFGVGGIARKAKAAHKGIGGVARQFYPDNSILYDYGYEGGDVTGGWTEVKWRGKLSALTRTKESDNLYAEGSCNQIMYTGHFGWATVNKIDFTNYTKLKAELTMITSNESGKGFKLLVTEDMPPSDAMGDDNHSDKDLPKELAVSQWSAMETLTVIETDVSDVNEEGYVVLNSYVIGGSSGTRERTTTTNVYRVWLE